MFQEYPQDNVNEPVGLYEGKFAFVRAIESPREPDRPP